MYVWSIRSHKPKNVLSLVKTPTSSPLHSIKKKLNGMNFLEIRSKATQ